MVIAVIAALYLGIRANFDPSIGPARLIYAFEAVIIGGLGSLWGNPAWGDHYWRCTNHRRNPSIQNGRSLQGILRFWWCFRSNHVD